MDISLTDTADSVENSKSFSTNCSDCPRLVRHLATVRERFPKYYNAPVPSWGGKKARLLIVGLAPGLHGANRTGRPFTGDSSGEALFEALINNGFAEFEKASTNVRLTRCRITNAVRCLPPGNRPLSGELNQCRPYLNQDVQSLQVSNARVNRCIVTLGFLAFTSVNKVLGLRRKFQHGARIVVSDRLSVFASYHPSRLNMNTKRLNKVMLNDLFRAVKLELDG